MEIRHLGDLHVASGCAKYDCIPRWKYDASVKVHTQLLSLVFPCSTNHKERLKTVCVPSDGFPIHI